MFLSLALEKLILLCLLFKVEGLRESQALKVKALIRKRQRRLILMGAPNWVRIPSESLLVFW